MKIIIDKKLLAEVKKWFTGYVHTFKFVDKGIQQNIDLKARLEAYEMKQSDWESFKSEFNHDMSELGKASHGIACVTVFANRSTKAGKLLQGAYHGLPSKFHFRSQC